MQSALETLGIRDENPGVFCGEWRGGGSKIDKISPVDGRRLASVHTASDDDYEMAISRAQEAFLRWRTTPGRSRRNRSPSRQTLANQNMSRAARAADGKITGGGRSRK
jgi:aldehyde dehydrogenase (NAD+)